MDAKTLRSVPLCAHHAQMAVRDWLETQSRVTGYWRDVLMSAGGNEDLVAVLDDHASFLAVAAHLGSADFTRPQ
jgi:hypothetical protein